MKNVTIIPSKDAALCILALDDAAEINYSVLAVWYNGIETQNSANGAVWHWSVVTYIGRTIGNSLTDRDCEPIWRGSYWRSPGDSEFVMNDLIGFLQHAAESPEDSDFLPQRVKEWAKRWEDILGMAVAELNI